MPLICLNFIGPILLGGESYGLANVFFALPYMLQGFCEPAISTVTIRSMTDREYGMTGVLDRLRRDSVVWVVLSILLIIAYNSWLGSSLAKSTRLALVLLGGAYIVLAVFTTHLIATGYGLRRFRTLVRSYLTAAAIQTLGLLLFRSWASVGFAVTQLLVHLVFHVNFLLDPEIRASLSFWNLRKQPVASLSRRVYFAALAPKLIMILLTAGLVMVAGVTLSTSHVAYFKVTQSMITAAAFLVPLSPELIQASVGKNQGRSRNRRKELLVFVGAIGLMILIAFGLGTVAPMICQTVFKLEPHGNEFQKMFLAMPFFLLITPLSSYLLAVRQDGVVTAALGVGVGSMATGYCLAGIPGAFAFGAIAYVIGAMALFHIFRSTPPGELAN